MLKQQFSRLYWLIKYLLARSNARRTSLARINRLDKHNILVLCYGNIYRSPFVAHYLTKHLKLKEINILSAGFFPKSGRKSVEKFIRLVDEYGIDLSQHSSRIVDKRLLDWANIIIIMDGKNYKLSLLTDTSVANKIIWLGALCDESQVEIPDPYEKQEAQQQEIVNTMVTCCDNLIKQLN